MEKMYEELETGRQFAVVKEWESDGAKIPYVALVARDGQGGKRHIPKAALGKQYREVTE